jgi:hypothetical protein
VLISQIHSATSITNAKGKIVKRYKHEDVKTPLAYLAQPA